MSHLTRYIFFSIFIVASPVFAQRSRDVEMDAVAAQVSTAVDLPSRAALVGGQAFNHGKQRIHRFDATFDNLPVFYETFAAQLDEAGQLGRTLVPTNRWHGEVEPHPFPDAATVASWVLDHGFALRAVDEPGWLVDENGRLRAVVRVETHATDPQDALALYLDAASGRIVESDLLFQTEMAVDAVVLGAVYPENPVTTPTIATEPLEHLDPDTDHLYGTYARAETCIEKDTCDTSAPLSNRLDGTGDGFIYEPAFFDDAEMPDPFAEVNAYRNITRVASWIHNEFGWDGLFAENSWITVRVGQAWENAAYYAGSKKTAPYIVFGTGEVNYAYDADTAYHEYGHAINDLFWRHSWMTADRYGMDTTMQAMEEAFADIWSATLSDDPVLDAYVTGSRNVDNDTTCPGSMLGEGHYDSRYISAFLWDIREAIGIDPFNHVFYRSLGFLEKVAYVSDFVTAMQRSASDLAEEGFPGVHAWHVDLIQETARVRGLLGEACLNRLVPLDDGERRVTIGYGRDRTRKKNYPFALQWVITADGDGQSAHVDLEWLFPLTDDEGAAVTPGYRVHVRKNAPVEVTWRDPELLEEGDEAFEVIADYTWSDSPPAVEVPIRGGAPLEWGDRVYVLLSANSPEPVIAMAADLEMIPEPTAAPPAQEHAEEDYSGRRSVFADSGCSTIVASPDEVSAFRFMLVVISMLYQR